MKLRALNELNCAIGEGHGRAKLTDHEIELMVDLLEARRVLLAEYSKVGLSRGEIRAALHKAQLSYRGIAAKFEVSHCLVLQVDHGRRRSQYAVRWVVPKPA